MEGQLMQAAINRFETAFGEWVVLYRWWIIFATAFVMLSAAIGVRFLSINNDTRVFFCEENSRIQSLKALENTYNKINTVLFALAPKYRNVFTCETLAAVEELTEVSWQIPYSSRVNSITNFQHTRAEDEELIIEDLVQNNILVFS
jgi:predicted RND superfamily exporter protein